MMVTNDWLLWLLGAILLATVGFGIRSVLTAGAKRDDDIQKLWESQHEISKQISANRLHAAETYTPKDDLHKIIDALILQMNAGFSEVKAAVRELEVKLDRKADKQ